MPAAHLVPNVFDEFLHLNLNEIFGKKENYRKTDFAQKSHFAENQIFFFNVLVADIHIREITWPDDLVEISKLQKYQKILLEQIIKLTHYCTND